MTTGPPLTYTGLTSRPSAENKPNSFAILTGSDVFQDGEGYSTLMVFARTLAARINARGNELSRTRIFFRMRKAQSVIRSRAQSRERFGALPFLQRVPVLQRLQFTFPDLANQDQRPVRSPERFSPAQFKRALTDLRRVILNPDDVRPLGAVNILDADV